ncbi:MAG: hypothetical protein H0T79_18665 [Deltaproteobacteria bacterium]|nr:hypothetical protein [Deltaproteobacteria bacterium]
MKYLATLLGLASLVVVGCGEPKSVLVRRPTSPVADAAVTAMWSTEVSQVARDGDWILTRSYYALADAITLTTPGENLSHASILDAQRGTIIEAVGAGVREIPLSELVARNHYVIVVRPSRMTADDQRAALARARTRVGAPYDAAGMFGVDHEDAFYCSELVYWASQTEARSGSHETVVTPADLMKYGEVIYWSGARTDPQVMELASARAARPARTAATLNE